VPSVVSERTRRRIIQLAGGGLVEAPGPDLSQLASHVVNLGNDGRLSQSGRFTSTSAQLDQIFEHMGIRHAEWGAVPRRIVIYAHGGLDSEKTGLTIAQHQVNWWLRNKVYPVTFAWETGLTETFGDQLSDMIGARLPAAGWSFNVYEQVDRMVEKVAKTNLRWVWDQMKQNADAASEPLPRNYRQKPDQVPGGSLTIAKLKAYLDQRPRVATEVHLVGHSAGSIFLMNLIERLVASKIKIASLTYLAAAIRTDDWMRRVLPHLENGDIAKFAAFGMNPARELDDVCGSHGVAVYHKSLLYLVSRALERPANRDDTEVPLVGMAHFATTDVEGKTLTGAVDETRGDLIWSPSSAPDNSRSDAAAHGGFDDDSPTMTSVLLRILDQDSIQAGNQYVANLPAAAEQPEPTVVADQPPEIVLTEVQDDTKPPGLAAAKGPKQAATKSATRRSTVAPRHQGSRVLAAMERDGWQQEGPG
jgi:pimeloyl-ACP methyl ester carboxylesterase